jgi:rare lipoprotein A
VRPVRSLLAAALLILALPASAQEATQPPAPAPAVAASADEALLWAPAPGVVVAVADSAALAALVVPSDEIAEAEGVLVGSGRASYYGEAFRGRRTASGERFDPDGLTAAHRTLPFGTRLRVTNERNDQSVVVRVTDRGPFHGARIIDLSKGAARRIGMVRSGTARVRIERL